MEKCPFCSNKIDPINLSDSSGNLLGCNNCDAEYCRVQGYSDTSSNLVCFKTNNYSILITDSATKISNKEETKVLACFNEAISVNNYSFEVIDNKINRILPIS